MTRIDVVVTVRDEEENIHPFLDEVRRLTLPDGVDLRVMFVEDSSKDGTRNVLRRVARTVSDVTYYSLENRFGQGLATVFGVARCNGDAVITMDGDGTHPVCAIPVLVKGFLQGNDVVQCVRKAPPDREAYRNIGAAVFHLLARVLTGLDTRKQNLYFRLMSADVAKQFLARRRYWRFVRFPLPEAPGRLSFVEVEAIDRKVGHSKYNFVRLAMVAVDGVLSLLSRTRLLVSVALVAALGFLLWQLGARELAIGLALVHAALIARYLVLEWSNPLAQIKVVESAAGGIRGFIPEPVQQH